MISTRDLSALPNIPKFKALSQLLAMLDAIISPEWESRYYSFNNDWAEQRQIGSMRNGSGDEMFALFTPSGVILKGNAHEAPLGRTDTYGRKSDREKISKNIYEDVPRVFKEFLDEPAFSIPDVTFCIWNLNQFPGWARGKNIVFPEENDPDGSQELLAIYDARPETYQQWAQEYYEQDVELDAVKSIYAFQPLTEALVEKLNPDLSLEDIRADAIEIGYPLA